MTHTEYSSGKPNEYLSMWNSQEETHWYHTNVAYKYVITEKGQ